jgi:peptide/nickel transport system permease protein
MAVAPGTILFLTVLACTLVGDGLRDAFDPRSRERRGDPMPR